MFNYEFMRIANLTGKKSKLYGPKHTMPPILLIPLDLSKNIQTKTRFHASFKRINKNHESHHLGRKSSRATMGLNSENLEIFATFFLRIALKDIFVTLKIRD